MLQGKGCWQKVVWLAAFVLIVALLGAAAISRWPGLAAQAARPLRQIIGNRGVAVLETVLFEAQDGMRQAEYRLGLQEAEAPWPTAVPPLATVVPAQPSPSPTIALPTLTRPSLVAAGNGTHTPEPTEPTEQLKATVTPTPPPTPVPWTLSPLTPFGNLAGEGEWQAYLHNEAGDVVGLRTFLQPDAERPYALVAVVAFDLRKVDLRYVLGSQEPAVEGGLRGSGFIPVNHLQANRLIATFNGGFMASHGAYGAMADGLEALPAKDGYATVAIYRDGEVRIGNWGDTILADGDFIAWRQNARLVVEDGEINPRVYNGSITTWGGNINGDIVTWRSGLGINSDNTVLYFLAGPSMSMPTLAAAMTAVGMENGFLLDINESWVHFAQIIPGADNEMVAVPLFSEGMETKPDRYLRQSDRDFFYIITTETAK